MRIPGKQDHRNVKNIAFIKSLTPLSTYPSQRAFTKPIHPFHVELAESINDLTEKLNYTKKDLLFFCVELQLSISDYTLSGFLNKKYGPAFPPSAKTEESLLKLQQFLKSHLRETKQNKNTQQLV